ncbi:hypothetical protein JNN96_37235 [Mycobacterium sp. DSM 3803]|nr:hypothetical protein [Mycobacterium sp. DSM 3803]
MQSTDMSVGRYIGRFLGVKIAGDNLRARGGDAAHGALGRRRHQRHLHRQQRKIRRRLGADPTKAIHSPGDALDIATAILAPLASQDPSYSDVWASVAVVPTAELLYAASVQKAHEGGMEWVAHALVNAEADESVPGWRQATAIWDYAAPLPGQLKRLAELNARQRDSVIQMMYGAIAPWLPGTRTAPPPGPADPPECHREVAHRATSVPIAFAPTASGGRRPERIDEVLSELADYWRQQPHLRLGQILHNFAFSLAATLQLDCDDVDVARELEDDALLGMLRTGCRFPSAAAHEYVSGQAARASTVVRSHDK